jgi:hypothetical protein
MSTWRRPAALSGTGTGERNAVPGLPATCPLGFSPHPKTCSAPADAAGAVTAVAATVVAAVSTIATIDVTDARPRQNPATATTPSGCPDYDMRTVPARA